jgi:hypothetical protein
MQYNPVGPRSHISPQQTLKLLQELDPTNQKYLLVKQRLENAQDKKPATLLAVLHRYKAEVVIYRGNLVNYLESLRETSMYCNPQLLMAQSQAINAATGMLDYLDIYIQYIEMQQRSSVASPMKATAPEFKPRGSVVAIPEEPLELRYKHESEIIKPDRQEQDPWQQMEPQESRIQISAEEVGVAVVAQIEGTMKLQDMCVRLAAVTGKPTEVENARYVAQLEQEMVGYVEPRSNSSSESNDWSSEAGLHAIVQRELRPIMETDTMLKYVFARSARKRVQMVFCAGQCARQVAAASHFIFRVTTDRLEEYTRILSVVQTSSDYLTIVETLCNMMFTIKRELDWEGDKIIVRKMPLTTTYMEKAIYNLIRYQILGKTTIVNRAAHSRFWSSVMVQDITEDIVDMEIRAKRIRMIIVDTTSNAQQVEVAVSEGDKRCVYSCIFNYPFVVQCRVLITSGNSDKRVSVIRQHKDVRVRVIVETL